MNYNMNHQSTLLKQTQLQNKLTVGRRVGRGVGGGGVGGKLPCSVRIKKATSSSISLFVCCMCLLLRRLLCCVRRPRVVVSLAFDCWAISINPMITIMD